MVNLTCNINTCYPMKKSIYFFTRAGQCCCSEDFQAKIQYWLNASNQRIHLKNLPSSLIAIKNELTVEKKNLSAIKNLRTCAPDQRPSAAVAGYLGAFIISLVLSLIILMDCSKLMTNLRFCQLSSKWDLFNLREKPIDFSRMCIQLFLLTENLNTK